MTPNILENRRAPAAGDDFHDPWAEPERNPCPRPPRRSQDDGPYKVPPNSPNNDPLDLGEIQVFPPLHRELPKHCTGLSGLDRGPSLFVLPLEYIDGRRSRTSMRTPATLPPTMTSQAASEANKEPIEESWDFCELDEEENPDDMIKADADDEEEGWESKRPEAWGRDSITPAEEASELLDGEGDAFLGLRQWSAVPEFSSQGSLFPIEEEDECAWDSRDIMDQAEEKCHATVTPAPASAVCSMAPSSAASLPSTTTQRSSKPTTLAPPVFRGY